MPAKLQVGSYLHSYGLIYEHPPVYSNQTKTVLCVLLPLQGALIIKRLVYHLEFSLKVNINVRAMIII